MLALHGPPIYVRKQIVHNIHVVRRLEQQGAIFVESEEDVPEGATVVLSAHGVAPEVHRNAALRRLRAIDATCPLVTKVHNEARRFAGQGYTIFLIGHAGHEEVVGTMGEAPEEIVLVQTLGDVALLPEPRTEKLAYITQTTLSVDETTDIIAALQRRFPTIVGPPKDDICYATTNRQAAVKSLAREVDLVLVIGSANSSNSQRLVDVTRDLGVPAHLIDDESQILDSLARRRRDRRHHVRRLGARVARRARRRLVPRARRRAGRRAPPDRGERALRAAARRARGASAPDRRGAARVRAVARPSRPPPRARPRSRPAPPQPAAGRADRAHVVGAERLQRRDRLVRDAAAEDDAGDARGAARLDHARDRLAARALAVDRALGREAEGRAGEHARAGRRARSRRRCRSARRRRARTAPRRGHRPRRRRTRCAMSPPKASPRRPSASSKGLMSLRLRPFCGPNSAAAPSGPQSGTSTSCSTVSRTPASSARAGARSRSSVAEQRLAGRAGHGRAEPGRAARGRRRRSPSRRARRARASRRARARRAAGRRDRPSRCGAGRARAARAARARRPRRPRRGTCRRRNRRSPRAAGGRARRARRPRSARRAGGADDGERALAAVGERAGERLAARAADALGERVGGREGIERAAQLVGRADDARRGSQAEHRQVEIEQRAEHEVGLEPVDARPTGTRDHEHAGGARGRGAGRGVLERDGLGRRDAERLAGGEVDVRRGLGATALDRA